MKKIFTTIILASFCFNTSFAELNKVILGFNTFSIYLPSDYIHVDKKKTARQIIKEYKGQKIDKNYLKRVIGPEYENTPIEYILHKKLNPNGNSINFVYGFEEKSAFSAYLEISKKDLCDLQKELIIASYRGVEKKQYYCDFIKNISSNIDIALKMIHDGRLPKQKLVQYQFAIKNDFVGVTMGCLDTNCNKMEEDLLNIIKSFSIVN